MKLHLQKFDEKKIVCQGVVPSTPVKVNQNSVMGQEVPTLQGSVSQNSEMDITIQSAQGG